MKIHNPAHPGDILKGWVSDMGITVTAFADHVGISCVVLSRVLNGRAGLSADMDLRLSEALGTSPGYWLAMQTQRDLWTVSQAAKTRPRIQRMKAAPVTV